MSITVLEKTKNYVVVKIPRKMFGDLHIVSPRKALTTREALKILRSGMAEYRSGKTKPLASLRELR